MKHLLITAFVFISTLFTTHAQVNEASQTVKVLEAKTLENIVYKEVGETKLLMDIYLPKDGTKKKYPAVVYMHGGGWATGNKSKICNGLHNGAADILLENGIAVISINYRLINEGNNIHTSDCISDAKDALAFLNKNGKRYGINSKKLVTWGVSAGGHLAMMTGYTDLEDFPGDKTLLKKRVKPVAVISWYGSNSFEIKDSKDLDNRSEFLKNLHKKFTSSNNYDEIIKMALKVSPIKYVDSKDAHTLIMSGDKDAGINIEQAYNLKEKLDQNGVESKLVVVKNAGHTWVGENINPSLDEIFKITADYAVKELVGVK